RDQRGDAEDQADVGAARADHGAEGDRLMVGERGLGRDRELGRRRAVGDDGEPDDERLDAERARHLRRSADQPLRAPVQDRDPREDEQDIERRDQTTLASHDLRARRSVARAGAGAAYRTVHARKRASRAGAAYRTVRARKRASRTMASSRWTSPE